ncbi:hypothetical protein FQN54_003955 [Arachnomyces sp. PD_36]|nr:hypothetical protein FQN54_003955 [Arachnomyces sp. PD_36]
MPCFKGLAVSIHTPNGPLPEHSVQRHSRASRIACYIPVPPPQIPDGPDGKPEQSTFAISITLLTSGQNVPYSTPKPTAENPDPKPKVVGGLPGQTGERGKYANSISPYQPLTASSNETVAAYIYFDGRQKEEVATLLRKGEETWVNSRWVGIPESEGGGLAEREFLFREVGLERWLNGLDLEGKDAAAKIERRKQKVEKRRLKRENREKNGDIDIDMDDSKEKAKRDILRYGNDERSPLEDISDDDSSDSGDHDDDPIPETAGQIKVALFRVVASGEVKRGEYAPQFDAHDDDEDAGANGKSTNGQGSNDADIDHTTSFAKPKSLDPKSISTQTVTGIDPTEKPYAIFTFMYRGERQLQKMGILSNPKAQDKETPGAAKRRSTQTDFSKLAPLKPGGAVGFVGFRDVDQKSPKKNRKGSKKGSESDMDSDDDDDEDPIIGKVDVEESKDGNSLLSPDDIRRQGELAEGVRKIKLKRQASSEPLPAGNGENARASKSNTPASVSTPPATQETTAPPLVPGSGLPEPTTLESTDPSIFIGSPLKKQRASLSNADDDALRIRMGSNMSSRLGEVLGSGGDSNTDNAFGGSILGAAKKQQQDDNDDTEL